MRFSSATALALVAAVAIASPLAAIPEADDVAPILGEREESSASEWRKPTSEDLELMASNGTFLTNEAGEVVDSIGKRQSGVYRTNSGLEGNGNPHQNPYQQQQTQTLPCGPGGTCSVSLSHSHSISWSASANAAYGWISGGFGVQETFTTGQSLTCDGNAGGDVCIWYSYGVTAYTVRATQCYYYNGQTSMCRDLGTRTLFSPNNCQPGQPYCVRGSACRNENDGYYATDNAPAGGPPC